MKLSTILSELWAQALDAPGKPKARNLNQGLRAMLKALHDGRVISVYISRQSVYPSDREWQTIVRDLPVKVSGVPQHRFEFKGRLYLSAQFDVPMTFEDYEKQSRSEA